MPDFTSAASVKAYLGITIATDDTLLATLVTAYSTWMRTFLNRTITSQQFTITRSGRDEQTMLMPDWPITAVSTLMIDGVVIPAQSTWGGYGYRFSDRAITLDCLRFTRGVDNVSITFTAGYASVPADLAQACVELVALHYREKDRFGLASKGLAGETTAFITKAMPESVKAVLNQYARVIPL